MLQTLDPELNILVRGSLAITTSPASCELLEQKKQQEVQHSSQKVTQYTQDRIPSLTRSVRLEGRGPTSKAGDAVGYRPAGGQGRAVQVRGWVAPLQGIGGLGGRTQDKADEGQPGQPA